MHKIIWLEVIELFINVNYHKYIIEQLAFH